MPKMANKFRALLMGARVAAPGSSEDRAFCRAGEHEDVPARVAGISQRAGERVCAKVAGEAISVLPPPASQILLCAAGCEGKGDGDRPRAGRRRRAQFTVQPNGRTGETGSVDTDTELSYDSGEE
ncbi:hypothetical protein OH76DRAFT_1424176, partial [Lentinus brumalis]